MSRFFCPLPLNSGVQLDLPPAVARHVQVLRLQPGETITLFNGEGGECAATITRMGRSDVQALIGAHHAIEREAARAVHLLVGIMANERMDWLIEKATELGAASITPVLAERSVLKLKGERAEKKQAHWQAVAIAAAEQCGRNRVPTVGPSMPLEEALNTATAQAAADAQRCVLSLAPGAQALGKLTPSAAALWALSGPEGGLSPREEAAAWAAGFVPVTLGARVLRAETAPLALLAALLCLVA
jgi:16S rRNA (uracil1498-N3)-methyltransferase